MASYLVLMPELLLVVAALVAIFAELLPGGDRGSAWTGAALSLAAAVVALVQPASGAAPFGGLIAFDGPARFARVGVAVLGAIWMLWTAGRGEGRVREAISLASFSMVGCMFMAEARELITLLLAVELATLPAYVLVGYRRNDVKGLEGAIKYFLLSVLTTLVMLYGFSFVYGLTGTTRYGGIDLKKAGALGVLALLLSLVGLFAKLSAAPFHYWAPDAYAGSTPWAVAFVSTVPKLAGAVAAVRFIDAALPKNSTVAIVVAIVAALSMLVGNLAALNQADLRRLMAYSGVAHAGYLLIGASTLSSDGYSAAVLYALAYAIPSMGIMLVAAEEGGLVSDLGGLSQRRAPSAWGVVVMLLSLIGVPPMIGFFGKFGLIISAQSHGLTWLAVIAVVASVISAGYYLRIVRTMFFAEPPSTAKGQRPSWAASTAFTVSVVLTVATGLASGVVSSAVGAFLH